MQTERTNESTPATPPYPVSPNTWLQIVERIKDAADAQANEIIACRCQQTCHCIALHLHQGRVFLVETIGPLTESQADGWAAGLDDTGEVRIIH